MASNIISETIDDQYPVAGVDNNSQGFRDNFNVIKTNFTEAKSNIEDLQTKSLLNSPLTGQSESEFEANNTLDYASLINANLRGYTIETNSSIIGDGDRTLSHAIANYFKINVIDQDITVTLSQFPDIGKKGEIYIHLQGNGAAAHNVTFAGLNPSSSTSNLFTDGNTAWIGSAVAVSLTTSDAVVIKAWSINGGDDVYLQYVGVFSAA